MSVDVEGLWVEYDRASDTLYINFGDDVDEADEAILVGDDVVVRVRGDRLVSITVSGFSRKAGLEV